MKKIIFVTGNLNKVITAQKHLDTVELVHYNYDLIEPRSESIEEIAKYKVIQAYEQVKEPCIALDSGFYIESLNGWPATFVNFNLEKLGLDNILKMLEGESNRKAYFKECIAYYDGIDIKYFYGISKGSISNYIGKDKNNTGWSSLHQIFIPENCDRVLSEMSNTQKDNLPDNHTTAFDELNKYLKQKCLSKKVINDKL